MFNAKYNLMKKEYKGYLIIEDGFDSYYVDYSNIKNWKNYEFKRPYLVDTSTLTNRKVVEMFRYVGNKTIEDAIDIYYKYKDLTIPKQPYSIVFDFWFNDLNMDVQSFKKIFKTDNLNKTFLNVEKCLEWWSDFRKLDDKMLSFITDDKIKEFFEIQQVTNLINNSKAKNFNDLVF